MKISNAHFNALAEDLQIAMEKIIFFIDSESTNRKTSADATPDCESISLHSPY